MVERRTRNAQVVGSIPTAGSKTHASGAREMNVNYPTFICSPFPQTINLPTMTANRCFLETQVCKRKRIIGKFPNIGRSKQENLKTWRNLMIATFAIMTEKHIKP
jgi:hypothetical protein